MMGLAQDNSYRFSNSKREKIEIREKKESLIPNNFEIQLEKLFWFQGLRIVLSDVWHLKQLSLFIYYMKGNTCLQLHNLINLQNFTNLNTFFLFALFQPQFLLTVSADIKFQETCDCPTDITHKSPIPRFFPR